MAALKRWIIAGCWWVLRRLDAVCPACQTPVIVSTRAERTCDVCGVPILGLNPLKQHDGRYLCPDHKAAQ